MPPRDIKLTQKQPLPPSQPPNAPQLENPRRQKRTQRVPAKHAKEEDGDPSRPLLGRVPRRDGIQRARYVPRLGEAQTQAGGEEAGSVTDEDLHGAYEAEEEDLG